MKGSIENLKILWTCMIYEGDLQYLNRYCKCLRDLNTPPTEVRFIISGESNESKRILDVYQYKYQERCSNTGFNESFNLAYEYAVKNDFEWFISMSVRHQPQKDWIENLNLQNIEKNIGMITTRILNKDKIFNIGHCINDSHGCFDFGKDITNSDLLDIKPGWIYCPCSGAAVYRTKALMSTDVFYENPQPLNGSLFKSYNCDALGYLVKSNGFLNKIEMRSISEKMDIYNSTSTYPNTMPLIVNQELSRLSNIGTYRNNAKQSEIFDKYLSDLKSRKFKIKDICHPIEITDPAILIHMSKIYIRKFRPKNSIESDLSEHINHFKEYKLWRKRETQF